MNTVHRWLRFALPLLMLPLLVVTVRPQNAPPPPPPVINAVRTTRCSRSFRFRSIGPASMGGRIDDIAVSESDPNVIYIGYAVGGVFKSENNGVTFEPVFQTYGTASIGDIAIHPTNPNIVYVGTGEPNNRQTSSFGDGIYKTTDGGKTFTNIGLKETQTIARIVIDPKNPETVYVASPGHLFGPNPDRGVYKTTDGGKTWNKIKFIDDDTGFTDIALDPVQQQHHLRGELSAAPQRLLLQRRRSGQRALEDARTRARRGRGSTGNGLPPGTYGRIALDVSRSNPNVVYAQIEAGEVGQPERIPPVDSWPRRRKRRPPARPPWRPRAARAGQAGQPGADGRPLPSRTPEAPAGGGRRTGRRLRLVQQRRSGARLRGGTRRRPPNQPPPAGWNPPALDPKQGGVLRSDNKGKSWTFVSNCNSRPMYFSQLRVDPTNDKTIYVAGLPVAKSLDGGKTFATLDDAGGNVDRGTSISTRSGSIRRTRSTS